MSKTWGNWKNEDNWSKLENWGNKGEMKKLIKNRIFDKKGKQ